MKNHMFKGMIFALAVTLLSSPPVIGVEESDLDETQVKAAENQMDRDGAAAPDRAKVDSIAKQFNVQPSVVQDLRSTGKGWGAVTIELSMAQHLSKTDPKTYPTLSDGLKKVEGLRDQGQGWGRISKDLGFKLGPVISGTERADRSFRSEREGTPEKSERFSQSERPMRPERPEHSGRPDRMDQPGHGAR